MSKKNTVVLKNIQFFEKECGLAARPHLDKHVCNTLKEVKTHRYALSQSLAFEILIDCNFSSRTFVLLSTIDSADT
jgi:hypothetical protein